MTRRNSYPRLVALLGVAALGCVGSPPPVAQRVRGEYERAASDPRVAEHATVQLSDAEKAVQRLEKARRGDRDGISHLAVLAEQRIAIARAAGEAGAAEDQVAQLGEQRDKLRLEARTFEADQAQAEAAESRADAETARGVAASAINRARDLEARLEELKAEQTERGLVMTMSDVPFEFNSAQLLPGAERALGEVAKLLNEFPDRAIAIEGHTDGIGSDAYNRNLSEQRAESVATFLRSRGVAASRISVRGLGESLPVASNDEDAGRQANRRVEIVLAEPSSQLPAVSTEPTADPMERP